MTQQDFQKQTIEPEDEMQKKIVKKGGRWKWIAGAVAACLVLMMTLSFVSLRYHAVAEKPLKWKPVEETKPQTFVSVDYSDFTLYYSPFVYGYTFEAKVLKLYPDRYYDLASNSWHRVMEVSVENVIVGENVPEVVYCRLPDKIKNDDIKQYDLLILTVAQIGVEGCRPLLNTRTNRLERFGAMVFVGNKLDGVESGFPGLAAFTDGVIDSSVESLDGWGRMSHSCGNCGGHKLYPYRKGRSLQEVRDAIIKLVEEYSDKSEPARMVRPSDNLSLNVKSALNYVRSTTENSFFVSENACNYVRYIDGHRTNETVKIDWANDQVVYSEVQFTAEDILNIDKKQNAEQILSDINPKKMTPPSVTSLQEGHELVFDKTVTHYRKINGRVYAVVLIGWREVIKEYPKYMGWTVVQAKFVTPEGNVVDYNKFVSGYYDIWGNWEKTLDVYLASL